MQIETSGLKEVCTKMNEVVRDKEEVILIVKSEVSEKDRSLTSLKQKCGSMLTKLEMVHRKILSLEVSWLQKPLFCSIVLGQNNCQYGLSVHAQSILFLF